MGGQVIVVAGQRGDDVAGVRRDLAKERQVPIDAGEGDWLAVVGGERAKFLVDLAEEFAVLIIAICGSVYALTSGQSRIAAGPLVPHRKAPGRDLLEMLTRGIV